MPLSADNVVQENNGATASGTSHVVTLPSGTTAGNTLVVAIYTPGTGVSALPSGFLNAKTQTSTRLDYKVDVAAAETSWTYTTSGTTPTLWYVAELSNVEPVLPVDVTVGATTSAMANGSTASTGTSTLTAGLSTVAFAVFTSPAPAASWAGYTNGFGEVADLTGSGFVLSVARLFENSTTRTFECTATLTTSGTGLTTDAALAVFRAADSPVVAPLAHFLGFEWGTHGGASATGTTSMFGGPLAPGGTWGTTYLIQAGSARNSSYGLRIAKSATSASLTMSVLGTPPGAVLAGNVRVVSCTGTQIVAEFSAGQSLLYDPATTKFGVRNSATGTPSWQSGTTALNTWVWVEMRGKVNTTTHHIEWRIETATDTYEEQAAADKTGSVATTVSYIGLTGLTASQTITVDFDDVVVSAYYTAYPLGPHEVRLLTVDPAGTPTISGTTTNFSTFASNGTLTAWNATTARNALDEVPVTVSTAADGVVQTAVGATDYMQFPMADYTLGPTEFVNGVRMLAPLWSGTGAGAGDLAIRGYDGTTETALATASQITPGSPTAISATAPVWRAAMWQSTNGWTQTELNACALRVGFSGDATPDMGVSAIYLEVAIGRTKPGTAIGDYAAAQVDPTRLGLMSVTVTPPASTGLTLRWTDKNGSGTQYTAALGTFTQQFDSASAADVTVIEVESDPELPDRE